MAPSRAGTAPVGEATVSDEAIRRRQRWMGVLAKARAEELAARIEAIGPMPGYAFLRHPEPGQVMVRARAGGNGAPFHLGEMTVTRCAVRLDDGTVGHGYVQGRDRDHAEHAAVLDALLQDAERHDALEAQVISPLEDAHRARAEARSRKAARTKVDFFTMIRGENPTP